MLKKWDLSVVFKDWNEWDASFKAVQESIEKYKQYEGKLNDYKTFEEFYNFSEENAKELYRLAVYAHMSNDLNTKDEHNDAKYKQVMILYGQLIQATAFVDPEKLEIGEEQINKFVAQSEKLKEYKFSLENLFRKQAHILSKDQEGIIANFSELSNISSALYAGLSYADSSSSEVILANGETIEVTNGNYRSYLMTEKNQEDRYKIFKAVFDHYADHKNTYAAIYSAVVNSDWANAKSRNYTSCVESYLFNDNVPVAVYETLINTTKTNTEGIKRYIELRKKALGIKDYHTYDRFLPLASSSNKYTYEEGLDMFYEAASKMPGDFLELAKKALKPGHVDVYEQDGKRTGAYSTSIYGYNPFILLNFTDTLSDVFTVAHEAGHSMHTLLASEAQPFATANYTIFVAEVASTFNEHLLLDYLMEKSEDKQEKIVLLQQAIDDILSTFYRQSLFADFEYQAHALVEKGQPITHDALSQIMIELYKQYYDIDITTEEVKQFVWAYIPHMNTSPFYVYKYATSFAASLKIYEDVKANKEGALDKYLGLLKSGGSEYPVDQVKNAGVDLTTKAPFDAVVSRLNDLIDQLEKLL